MDDERQRVSVRFGRILTSEEGIYGLILVSGMIVISNSLVGTSANALVSVIVTVLVFFAAHVYAGTISRLARSEGRAGVRESLVTSFHHSEGMLIVAIAPVLVLTLGVSRLVDDETAIWTALVLDTVLLGALGWFAVARWNRRFWARATSALITMGFGAMIVGLKALVHH